MIMDYIRKILWNPVISYKIQYWCSWTLQQIVRLQYANYEFAEFPAKIKFLQSLAKLKKHEHPIKFLMAVSITFFEFEFFPLLFCYVLSGYTTFIQREREKSSGSWQEIERKEHMGSGKGKPTVLCMLHNYKNSY